MNERLRILERASLYDPTAKLLAQIERQRRGFTAHSLLVLEEVHNSYGNGYGYGYGDGNGYGYGSGYGDGDGYGDGTGNGYGDGTGNGYGNGNGRGY